MPSNYIRIQLNDEVSNFGIFFPQNWAFFAPPPNSNHRLYYSYLDDDKQLLFAYEALEKIYQKKQNASMYNIHEELKDYLLSSTIINSLDFLVTHQDAYLVAFPDSTKIQCSKMARDMLNEKFLDLPFGHSLFNYGNLILQNNPTLERIEKQPAYMQISILEIPIPKFKDRHLLLDSNSKQKERLIFQSVPLKVDITNRQLEVH